MVAIPDVLFDPVPGNCGLRGPGILLVRFDAPDGVLAADEEGNLDNLAPDVGGGTVSPIATMGWTGPSRAFDAALTTGLIAADLAGKDTLLQRDVTIQALIAVGHGASAPAATGTVIARGVNDGTAAERYSYGLQITSGGGGGNLGVALFWSDTGGTIRTEAGATFQPVGADNIFLLTVTRRWESTVKVVSRYYVGDQLLAENTSTHGDIDGGTTGHTTIGVRKNGGVWEHFFTGVLDELFVADFEMSHDEVRQVWRRLAIHQPAGVAMFAGLVPLGSKWADDPGNRIGKISKIIGQSLGHGIAANEELRALWLPDAAPRETIGRWEAMCGLRAGPSDSLDVRRARVVGYLSRLQGYSIPAIQQALAETFDLAPADVQVLEFTQTITDGFATLETERWLAGDVGAFSILAGALHCAFANGTDIRWEPTRAHAFIETPIPTHADRFFASWKIGSRAIPPNTMIGAVVRNVVSNNTMWFGFYFDGAASHIGWAKFIGNVMGAFTALAADPGVPVWFRLEQIPPTGFVHINDRRYRFSWSTVGATPTSSFATDEEQFTFPDPEWIGFGAVSTIAAIGGDAHLDVDDFVLHTPNSDRPFYWFGYRDPALAGTPDMVGARLLVEKAKPAHTVAGVCENTSVLCDDDRDGLCDGGPMGAL